MGAGMPMLRMASTIEPLEKNVRRSGISGGDLAAHAVHIFEAADLVRIVERHLDGRGVGAGVGGVESGEVRHDSDVGNDHFEIGRVDHCRIRSSILAT